MKLEILLMILLFGKFSISISRSHPISAVTSDNPECSEIGAKILKAGGSSVDASIATMICIGAANLFASGIGGGGFALVKTPHDVEFYDFRESAPAGASENMFGGNEEASLYEGLAIAVPGELKGFEAMHKKHGRLQWSCLIMPTVRLCTKTGFTMTDLQLRRLKHIKNNQYLKSIFERDGRQLKKGEKFYLHELGQTLGVIAYEGANAFYQGTLTPSIVKTIQTHNGIITEQDLMRYEVKQRQPICSTYKQFNIITGPPPTAGIIVAKALNILEKIQGTSPSSMENADYLHFFVEALKFAYSSRICLSDPDFSSDEKMTNIISKILSKNEAFQNISRINRQRTFSPEYYFAKCANHEASSQGTSHVNVYGTDGVAVSMTSSINTPFGSMVVDEKLGIVFNNHMDDFSSKIPNSYGLPPSPYNLPKAGKRPQSSCAPLIITGPKNEFIAAIGASGGSQIISAIVEVIFAIFQCNFRVDQAINFSRIHHQLEPNELVIEDSMNAKVIEKLRQKGHVVKLQHDCAVKSAVSVIYRHEDGRLFAWNDPRKFSKAACVKRQSCQALEECHVIGDCVYE